MFILEEGWYLLKRKNSNQYPYCSLCHYHHGQFCGQIGIMSANEANLAGWQWLKFDLEQYFTENNERLIYENEFYEKRNAKAKRKAWLRYDNYCKRMMT